MLAFSQTKKIKKISAAHWAVWCPEELLVSPRGFFFFQKVIKHPFLAISILPRKKSICVIPNKNLSVVDKFLFTYFCSPPSGCCGCCGCGFFGCSDILFRPMRLSREYRRFGKLDTAGLISGYGISILPFQELPLLRHSMDTESKQ